jgi:hypothetical protein
MIPSQRMSVSTVGTIVYKCAFRMRAEENNWTKEGCNGKRLEKAA